MSEDGLTRDELQRAIDAHTLLPGEDPASPHDDDAAHWLRVYSELIAFKDSLLDRAEEAMEGLSPEALHDINVDRRMLRAQAARYRARYQYWMHSAARAAGTRRADPRPTSPPRLRIQVGSQDGDEGARPPGR